MRDVEFQDCGDTLIQKKLFNLKILTVLKKYRF